MTSCRDCLPNGLPHPTRRDFVRTLLGGAAAVAGLSSTSALAAAAGDTEFFVFVHAAGGWDVTLWSDPRNERRGIIHPASTENTDTAGVRHWVDAPLDGGVRTFAPVRAPGSSRLYGPSIGNLLDLHDRICVINGLAMNTVSHPDGSAFSASGRHLNGGRFPASSIDTMMANELGTRQTFPAVSVQFPSAYVGEGLDRRAVPLVIGQIGSVTRTLARAQTYDSDDERDMVTALLAQEARDLAATSAYPDVLRGASLQYDGLRAMLASHLQDVFSPDGLKASYGAFNYKGRFHGGNAVNAAFAVEAMRRNVVRCVSFALGGFDTHNNNYRNHALIQQEMFDMLAALIKTLDATPHPMLRNAKLSEHTHLLVVSDFCRTPQINAGGGRDHYPNNSALVISPRFKGGLCFGQTDVEQLLPAAAKTFSEGRRPIAPPDVLATFVHAFGISPRKYLRDGEVVPELLRA